MFEDMLRSIINAAHGNTEKVQPWDELSPTQQDFERRKYAQNRVANSADNVFDVIRSVNAFTDDDLADYYAVDAENNYNWNAWDARHESGYEAKYKDLPLLSSATEQEMRDLTNRFKAMEYIVSTTPEQYKRAYEEYTKKFDEVAKRHMVLSQIDNHLQRIAQTNEWADVNELLDFGRKAYAQAMQGKAVIMDYNGHSFRNATDETLYTDDYKKQGSLITPVGVDEATYVSEARKRYKPIYDEQQEYIKEYKEAHRLEAEEDDARDKAYSDAVAKKVYNKTYENLDDGQSIDYTGSDEDTSLLDIWRNLGGAVDGEVNTRESRPRIKATVKPKQTQSTSSTTSTEKPKVKATVKKKQQAQPKPAKVKYTDNSSVKKVNIVKANSPKRNKPSSRTTRTTPPRRERNQPSDSVSQRVLRETGGMRRPSLATVPSPNAIVNDVVIPQIRVPNVSDVVANI